MALDRAWTRRALSAALSFHLCGVLLAPNPTSYLWRKMAPLYWPYLGYLGLASKWAFFSPDPHYQPVFLDAVIHRPHQAPLYDRFPEENNPYWFRDRYSRRLKLVRVILGSDENIRNMFVRHLCREHPEMSEAQLYRVDGSGPSMAQVSSGERKITDTATFKTKPLGTYSCPKP